MSQVAKSASAFERAFLAILVLEFEDMMVRLVRPHRLAGVHGDRWTARLGISVARILRKRAELAAVRPGTSAENTWKGGGSNPSVTWPADRCPWFIRKKLELSTKSPPPHCIRVSAMVTARSAYFVADQNLEKAAPFFPEAIPSETWHMNGGRPPVTSLIL
jgi:hypothetical protein